MNLEFGLRDVIPDDAVAAWGARGILQDGFVDLMPDRTDVAVRTVEGQKKFFGWLGKLALPRLYEVAGKLRGSSSDLFVYDDETNKLHLRASPQSSHGYLYISAWMDAP